MCSYPESRFGQCYQWLAVWPVPVITGGTWPAPSRCRTHALLAAPRPPKNWQSRRLPAYLSLTTVHISMRDYLFRPCTPHNGMWHKWFVVYNNRTQRSGYDVLYSLRYYTQKPSSSLYGRWTVSQYNHAFL